ncbi:hypothetical protein [Dyella choica]|uniref:Uncharacterized protein n=1 Tax=Dyella choica TaxID=1927959 RepID=A0A432M558_9GAMM|nr:hypothetical protein [Dyella choica]RUL74955.1 hypothetical protein EKH80_12815 [Dyella choica]
MLKFLRRVQIFFLPIEEEIVERKANGVPFHFLILFPCFQLGASIVNRGGLRIGFYLRRNVISFSFGSHFQWKVRGLDLARRTCLELAIFRACLSPIGSIG